MNHRTILAGATALAVTSALTAGTVLGAAPASAAADPAPVDAGATWLASQLTDGLVFNPNFGGFTDYGLSVDTGLALAEVGEAETVDEISAALAPAVRSYYTYGVAEGKTHVSAGSLAKATAFAQDAGDDASSYGGQDLVAQLEGRVSTDPASAGRIGDVFFPEEPFEADYANTIGQAFAAKALDVEGSTLGNSVTEYLLGQQCEPGFFRLGLGATTIDTCDAAIPAATPNTDVTALAVINLLGQSDDTDVDAALDSALDWLADTQNPDGSFGSDAQITTANANSTGLAGWALGEAGRTAEAEKAATWLRAHQLTNAGACTTYAAADLGAIAYDDAALDSVVGTPITVEAQDQFRRASAQALPALRSAQAGTGLSVRATQMLVADGSTQPVKVSGAAPGSPVCLSNGRVQRTTSATGTVDFSVRTPAGTAATAYTVTGVDGTSVRATIRSLGGRTLGLRVRSEVVRGGTQRAIVTGLASGEKVSVRSGATVVSGKADARGAYNVTFRVSTIPGTKTVSVVGQFADRKAATRFSVVR